MKGFNKLLNYWKKNDVSTPADNLLWRNMILANNNINMTFNDY